MISADHFAQEVPLTQTQLAALLHEHAKDHVMKITFKKQVTADLVSEKLAAAPLADLHDAKKASALAKSLLEG